ncbi:MAG TPA: hypothetical protein DFS52_10410 [Myxococcales bacterium]|nr:hypothetical protein [Myxococcales bacterium]
MIADSQALRLADEVVVADGRGTDGRKATEAEVQVDSRTLRQATASHAGTRGGAARPLCSADFSARLAHGPAMAQQACGSHRGRGGIIGRRQRALS